MVEGKTHYRHGEEVRVCDRLMSPPRCGSVKGGGEGMTDPDPQGDEGGGVVTV